MPVSKELNSTNKDKLIADLKQIVEDTDALLKATANQANENVASLHTRIQKNLKIARGRLDELEVTLVDKTTDATREALQKTSEAVNQAREAAMEAAQKTAESVKKKAESGKATAQKAVAATREAANKALDALSNWIG